MKFITIILLALASLPMSAAKDAKMDKFVADLMGRMTLEEKLGQLNLTVCPDFVSGQILDNSSQIHKQLAKGELGGLFGFRGAEYIHKLQKEAVESSRLHIPLIFGYDVVHGMDITFPIPLAIAAAWDPAMAERMARISAEESAADGVCWTYAPMVDICHDARWGRIAECAGEDPYLGSQLAKAYVRGFQGDGDLTRQDNIMACVKHYALYGASEAGRDYNTVDMSRQRAFNEYMAPYKAGVEAGAGSFMASFNEFEGIPSHINSYLIDEVLRKQWGFDGFVVTDYNGIAESAVHGAGTPEDVAVRALKAGVDMDMMSELYISKLKGALETDRVSISDINQAVRRVLEAKYKLGLFQDPYKYCDVKRAKAVLYNPEHVEEARDMARRCPVLLKNDNGLLPLKKQGTVAVIGPMANNGYHMVGSWSGSSKQIAPVGLYEGIREIVGDKAKVVWAEGSWLVADSLLEYNLNHQFVGSLGAGLKREVHQRPLQEMIDEAVRTASEADVIIAALGENLNMNGEGSSRANPDIPEPQKQLLRALKATGKPVVLVSFAGRPLILSDVEPDADAILHAWFLGVQAGPAIAELLFGDAVPQGRLTASFPRTVGQLPMSYNHKNTGRPAPDNEPYKRFLSNYMDTPNAPLYPLGYGLSYTSFAYSPVTLSTQTLTDGGKLTASVTVSNTGSRAACETVQLYMRDPIAESTRPVKSLIGFRKVELSPGDNRKIEFEVSADDLKYYNHELQYVAEPGEYQLMIGHDSTVSEVVSFQYVK